MNDPTQTETSGETIDVANRGVGDSRRDLCRTFAEVLNGQSRENTSNTPDYVLAEYLVICLEGYENAVQERERHCPSNQEQTSTTTLSEQASGGAEELASSGEASISVDAYDDGGEIKLRLGVGDHNGSCWVSVEFLEGILSGHRAAREGASNSTATDGLEESPGPRLSDQLAAEVRKFAAECFRRLGTEDYAQMKITVHDYGWDDDDTPMLDADIEHRFHVDRVGGRADSKGAGSPPRCQTGEVEDEPSSTGAPVSSYRATLGTIASTGYHQDNELANALVSVAKAALGEGESDDTPVCGSQED